MEKAGRFLLIPDDIWHSFPEGTTFDIADVFFDLGWRDIGRCPLCASVRVEEPDHPECETEDVEFSEAEAADFCEMEDAWRLSDAAYERYA
jgi:hypothetical protein